MNFSNNFRFGRSYSRDYSGFRSQNKEIVDSSSYFAKSQSANKEEWANAAEFYPHKPIGAVPPFNYVVPPPHSYSIVPPSNVRYYREFRDPRRNLRVCDYYKYQGGCPYTYLPGGCYFIHGDMCEYCNEPALHPFNLDERKTHIRTCIKEHEKIMEESFAVAQSKEKVCGICLEVVWQKKEGDKRFGILPGCNHCFCLDCIRRWRQENNLSYSAIKGCPSCRVKSDFVCPSVFWVDDQKHKNEIIDAYKEALSKMDCKYFKRGEGKCKFGNKCFYRHVTMDGKFVDVGPPVSAPRRSFSADINLELLEFLLSTDDDSFEIDGVNLNNLVGLIVDIMAGRE